MKTQAYLSISADQWEEMRLDVNQHAPEEACGLLAGIKNQVQLVLPVANELHSPVRFRMAARDQLLAFDRIDQAGLVLLGIYHSHPNGPDLVAEGWRLELPRLQHPGGAGSRSNLEHTQPLGIIGVIFIDSFGDR
jgi:hypothetical protein